MQRKIFIVTLILAAAALAVVALPAYRQAQTAAAIPPPAPVTVPVSRGAVAETVTAPGQLVALEEQMVGVAVGGRLLELNVSPGSAVRAGDRIARLDPAPYEAALEEAQIRLARAEAAHRHQVAATALAIEAGQARLESAEGRIPSPAVAEVNLEAARAAEARAASAYEEAQARSWETAEALEEYRLEWVSARQAVEIAEAEYDRVRDEQRSLQQQVEALSRELAISSLEADQLAEAGVDPLLQRAVAEAEANLANTAIMAPFDGVVLELFATPGEQLPPGATLLLLADPAQGEVRTTVIEEDLSLVTIGQPATVYFDARPEVEVNGEVARIVPRRVLGEARPLYHVYLTLDSPLPEGIYPGMTADASLLVERADGVLRLPRALVAARSDGTATVEVWENDRAVARDITVGLRGDVFIAILDGLAEGDAVVGE